jgi:hypothetical protein
MIRRKSVAGGIAISLIGLSGAWLHPVVPETIRMGPAVEAEGVLASVDSDAGAFTISGANGTQEFYVTPATIIELGRTERIAFQDLGRFIGTASVVMSADTGARQDASRVTLLVMPFKKVLPGGSAP